MEPCSLAAEGMAVAQLDRFLYPLPEVSSSPLSVARWWERRRLRFNLIVGATGGFSLAVINALALLPPGSRGPVLPVAPMLVFGVMANVCFTAGPILDWACKAIWKDDPPLVGPFLFRQGLLFSVGLTLLPIALAAVDWGFRLLRFFL